MINQDSLIEWETVKSKSSIKKNINLESTDTKWETVRSRNKHENNETKKSQLNDIEENDIFIPGYVKKEIYEIINTTADTYEKNKLIRAVIKKYSQKNKSLIGFVKKLNIFAIHTACKMNNNELVAAIIDSEVHEKGLEYTFYTNAIGSSKNNNTVLLEAAFFGSDKCMSYLITRNADLKHINKYGEDIYKVIEQGRKYKKELFPKTPEAIDSIFNDCIELVKNAELKMITKETKEPIELKASGGAGASNSGSFGERERESERESESESKKESEKESESKFRSDYTFETLTEDVYTYLEDPSKFRELVTFLKSDEKQTELLIKVLDTDDMKDILVDYPYALKLI